MSNDTETLTLADFLLARIAEDEAGAVVAAVESQTWFVDGPAVTSGKHWVYATGAKFEHEAVASHIARHDPARVLADCKAKRAIVQHHLGKIRRAGAYKDTELMLLGRVYADHPDYSPEWA